MKQAIHLSLMLLLLASVSSSHADWPRFLGPNGNASLDNTPLNTDWPTEGLPELWRLDVGTGYSAPSVLGNRIVLHHRIGDDEITECFDATSGNSLWKASDPTDYIDPYGFNNGPRCTPTLTETHVYTFGVQGILTCRTLDSGDLVWQIKTHERWNVPAAFFGVGSTPLLHDEKLFVMVGGQPDSGMVCVDATSGEVLWEAVGQSTWDGTPKTGWRGEPTVTWSGEEKIASYASPVIATIHNEQHLLCLTRQGLVSLNPADGSQRFRFWFRAPVNESVNAANPVVIGDTIFLTNSYYDTGCVLLKVNEDGSSFTERWRNTNAESHWHTPILANEQLIVFSGRNESRTVLCAIDIATGEIAWQTDGVNNGERAGRPAQNREQQLNKFGRGAILLLGETALIQGERGVLALATLTPSGIEEKTRFVVPGYEPPCWVSPVLSDEKIYLRNESTLICLDAS